MITVAPVPSVCTAYQIHSFGFDGGGYQVPTRDGRAKLVATDSEEYKTAIRNKLVELLNTSKAHRKVCVFVFLTMEQRCNFALLEEFGFTSAFNAHNYKYPNSSRRLIMFTRDMNDWVHRQPPATQAEENPFGPVTQHNNPVIRLGRRRYFDAEYYTMREQGVIRRQSVAHFLSGEFPIDQWVDVPVMTMHQIPTILRGRRVEVQFADVNREPGVRLGEEWVYTDFEGRLQAQIVRVRRLS